MTPGTRAGHRFSTDPLLPRLGFTLLGCWGNSTCSCSLYSVLGLFERLNLGGNRIRFIDTYTLLHFRRFNSGVCLRLTGRANSAGAEQRGTSQLSIRCKDLGCRIVRIWDDCCSINFACLCARQVRLLGTLPHRGDSSAAVATQSSILSPCLLVAVLPSSRCSSTPAGSQPSRSSFFDVYSWWNGIGLNRTLV